MGLIFLVWPKNNNDLEIDFLNVGQGDSVLIKLTNQATIIIDGGPSTDLVQKVSSQLPYYQKTIDLLVLTHPHDDHLAGLLDLVKRYQVKKILQTNALYNSAIYSEWQREIKQLKIPVIEAMAGEVLNFGQDNQLQLRVLYPLTNISGQQFKNINNSSIVLKLTYGQTRVLFSADAEKEDEQAMIDFAARCNCGEQYNLSAQVLKVGHHGSSTASSENYLQAVNPEEAIIQLGKDNKFGFPHLTTRYRLARAKVRIWRNDLNGVIKLISNGQGYSISSP